MIPAAILLLRSPFTAVSIWLLVFPFFVHTYSYDGRYIYWALHRALVPLALIVTISREWIQGNRRPQLKIGWVEIFMLAFIGYAVINVLTFNDTPRSTFILFYDGVFIPLCLYGLVRYNKPTDKELKFLSWVALFTILTQTAISTLDWFRPGVLPIQWRGFEGTRTVGTFRNPSVYAITLAFSALLVFRYALQSKSRLTRLIFFTVFGWGIFSIFFSFSRDSWLGLAFVIVGLLLLQPKIVSRLIVIVLVFGTILGSTILRNEIKFAVERFEDKHTAEDRIVQTFASLRMIEERPWFGWGYQNYDLHNERYKTRVGDIALQTGSTSHNSFLTLMAEFGLIGFALYMFPAIWLLVKSVRSWKKIPWEGYQNKVWLATLWLFFLFQFVVNNFIDLIRFHLFGVSLWWLALGLIALTLDRVETRQAHEAIDAIAN